MVVDLNIVLKLISFLSLFNLISQDKNLPRQLLNAPRLPSPVRLRFGADQVVHSRFIRASLCLLRFGSDIKTETVQLFWQ